MPARTTSGRPSLMPGDSIEARRLPATATACRTRTFGMQRIAVSWAAAAEVMIERTGRPRAMIVTPTPIPILGLRWRISVLPYTYLLVRNAALPASGDPGASARRLAPAFPSLGSHARAGAFCACMFDFTSFAWPSRLRPDPTRLLRKAPVIPEYLAHCIHLAKIEQGDRWTQAVGPLRCRHRAKGGETPGNSPDIRGQANSRRFVSRRLMIRTHVLEGGLRPGSRWPLR